MIHRLRLGFAHNPIDCGAIAQISGEDTHLGHVPRVGRPAQSAHAVALLFEVLTQMTADEAAYASDQRAHRTRVPTLVQVPVSHDAR